ncbi:hypothetical protein QYE76_030953 [Lolium multiflorum]|uniref:Reverse transcriptase domain-containing protein n=1 Tax=Lolium multiflorum TaxID=4521 RepID=A0AAD8VJQ8_LOLMU|nr:hypothetical protein QYE76_030953 [Lolium multiflorum]
MDRGKGWSCGRVGLPGCRAGAGEAGDAPGARRRWRVSAMAEPERAGQGRGGVRIRVGGGEGSRRGDDGTEVRDGGAGVGRPGRRSSRSAMRRRGPARGEAASESGLVEERGAGEGTAALESGTAALESVGQGGAREGWPGRARRSGARGSARASERWSSPIQSNIEVRPSESICWDTIKVDVMNVIQLFGSLHSENFHWLNSANIALLPKKDGAEAISDYRPISLIHAIAKMLALRLVPLMNDLVSSAQSAFIKRRSIHDNFLYVKNLATRLHKNKTVALLFKLYIRNAFDSIRWDHIIDLLQRRGFPHRFREWVLALFITSTSRVLLNGVVGPPISHGRGLRQGDPLSPLLFVLGIDPFSQILEHATDLGPLHKLRGRGSILRSSLYADDVAVFIAPFKEDIQNLADILGHSGMVTGLHTNFEKSSVVPIRCVGVDLDDILEGVPAARTSFPLWYLGLPLSVHSLRRVDFQFLEDKCVGKLPS